MIKMRSAKEEDAGILTDISFAAKRYWQYPEEYYRIWKSELTVGAEYIRSNDVWVYEDTRTIVGYYSLVTLHEEIKVDGVSLPCGHWLDHMFIRPPYIGSGIGTEMFQHLRNRCEHRKIENLNILADPNAKGFYEKMGCRFTEDFPSTITGRTTPYLVLQVAKG
ncbi:MAG: GNAT family N-acetyltransferase [Desulforhopalus sp.]